MKKIILAAIALFALNTVVPAQQPVSATNSAGAKKETKATGKTVTAKSKKTGETAAKPENTVHEQKLKKDGTPDKRYKENKHLKKDGTPDKRYKDNKSVK